MKMGYPKERILKAYREVSKASHSEDMGSSWLSVLCRLREDEVYGLESQTTRKETPMTSTPYKATGKMGFQCVWVTLVC